MKNLTEILATKIPLLGDVQVAFDVQRRTDSAHAVRGRFFLLPDEGPPSVIGKIVYTEAFLTQTHDYLRNAYLEADAEKLLDRFAEGTADL